MRLILSSRHPRNSTYATETGQILYKVNKPRKFGYGVATIRKAVGTVHGVWQGNGLGPEVLVPSVTPVEKSPFDDPELEGEGGDEDEGRCRHSRDSQDDAPFADSDSELDSVDGAEGGSSIPSTSGSLQGHFAFLAQIEFHGFSPTRFLYNNLNVSVDELFRKEGRSWYGSRGRVWKASDGQEYRWDLCADNLEMVKNDESKKPVVVFKSYHSPHNPFKKPRQASMDIDDSCVPILDEIIMTFVYCHRVRKDRNH